MQRDNHSTADGLYSKMHPNKEPCNAPTSQLQMACIAKSIRTRRPATQQPLNRRWPLSQKASEQGGLQRNNHSAADGLYLKKHPNEDACNATTTQLAHRLGDCTKQLQRPRLADSASSAHACKCLPLVSQKACVAATPKLVP